MTETGAFKAEKGPSTMRDPHHPVGHLLRLALMLVARGTDRRLALDPTQEQGRHGLVAGRALPRLHLGGQRVSAKPQGRYWSDCSLGRLLRLRRTIGGLSQPRHPHHYFVPRLPLLGTHQEVE